MKNVNTHFFKFQRQRSELKTPPKSLCFQCNVCTNNNVTFSSRANGLTTA